MVDVDVPNFKLGLRLPIHGSMAQSFLDYGKVESNHCRLPLSRGLWESMGPYAQSRSKFDKFSEHFEAFVQTQCFQCFMASIVFWLVVSNIFYFPFHIWDVILPIDALIFFRGVGQSPTSPRYHYISLHIIIYHYISLYITYISHIYHIYITYISHIYHIYITYIYIYISHIYHIYIYHIYIYIYIYIYHTYIYISHIYIYHIYITYIYIYISHIYHIYIYITYISHTHIYIYHIYIYITHIYIYHIYITYIYHTYITYISHIYHTYITYIYIYHLFIWWEGSLPNLGSFLQQDGASAMGVLPTPSRASARGLSWRWGTHGSKLTGSCWDPVGIP